MEPDGDDGLASCWRMVENVESVDELLEDLKNHTFTKGVTAFTYREVFCIEGGRTAGLYWRKWTFFYNF